MFNIKKAKKYNVTVEEVSGENKLQFETESPEDILAIVEKLKQYPDFDDNDAATLGIGLKLFTAVMMKNKENPIFEPLMPAFKDFMKGLKGSKRS